MFSKVGVGVRGRQKKQSIENQKFGVLKCNHMTRRCSEDLPLQRQRQTAAWGPGGIFSNPSHYPKAKLTSRTKRPVAPRDKRIALRGTEQAASHTRLQAGEGKNGRMTESRLARMKD